MTNIKKAMNSNFKLSKIAVATSAVLMTSLTMSEVYAEEQKDETLEVIEVKGMRTSVIAGLDLKRNSINIVDAVSAEDIGKFPDANLAEALQRIPDIAIDRDGGEGRKVTIRGLGPEFNSVLLNGRKLASSEATRAFSFDTISSELVSEMLVYKTQSAGLSEGGIGGTIDVRTARPLNFDGLTVSGTLQGSYEENSESSDPQASFLISNTFMDGKFGALFGATYQERNNTTYTTNVESIRTAGAFLVPAAYAYSNDGFDPVYRPTELNRDVINDSRERLGLNGVLQYRPSDALEVTVDFIYSKFDVHSTINNKSSWFWDVHSPNFPGSQTALDSNGVVTTLEHGLNGFWGTAGVAFNRADNYRNTETSMFGTNVEYSINDDIKLVVDAAWSSAIDDNKGKNSRRSSEMFISPENAAKYGNSYTVDLNQSVPAIENIPELSANNPNMANELRVMRQFQQGDDIEANNYQFKADLVIGSFDDLIITTGFSYEVTEKMNDAYVTNPDIQKVYQKGNGRSSKTYFGSSYDAVVPGVINVDSTDLGQPGSIDNDMLQFDLAAYNAFISDPVNALAAVDGNVDNRYYQAFLANGSSFDAVETGDSWEVEEAVTSLYVEGEYEFMLGEMDATFIGGVRYTQTDLDAKGFSQIITNLTGTPCAGNPAQTCLEPTYAAADGPDGLTTQKLSNSYSDVLPSVTLNVNLTDDLILRLASSKSLTRPFLEDMAPKFRPGALTPDIRAARTNNEDLTPYTSFNLDASLEWYFDEGSIASVAVFTKDIKDFIIKQTVENVPVDTIAEEEYQNFTVTRPTNGTDDVEITGVSINLTQTFDSGFGYQANYTYTDTNTNFNPATFDSTKVALPGLGDSMNLVAFYESGAFGARVAYNWRDSFLRSSQFSSGMGWGEAYEEPSFADDYSQIDARVSYSVVDGVTVFLEGTNLTEETLSQHGRFDNIFVSYENFGRRFVAGVSARF